MRHIVLSHLPAVVLLAIGHPWLAFAALAAGHAYLLAGTLIPSAPFFGKVVTRFDTTKQEVWLTFDDGPCPETTQATLDLLAAHHAKATFFLIGDRARAHPGLVAQIRAQGHHIGNHTQTHPATAFWRLPPRRIRSELHVCQETLTNLGQRPTVFRAPAGMKNPFVHPVLRALGLPLIGWSARGFDGTRTDPDAILARILPRVAPGAIVLLHEGRPTSTECTRRLLEHLHERGLEARVPIEFHENSLGTNAAPDTLKKP